MGILFNVRQFWPVRVINRQLVTFAGWLKEHFEVIQKSKIEVRLSSNCHVSTPKMADGGPNNGPIFHPVATGAAAITVKAHVDKTKIMFWAGWVRVPVR
jgi:hypothetical protein